MIKKMVVSFASRSLMLVPSLISLSASGCGDLLKQTYPAKTYFGLEPGLPNVAESATPACTQTTMANAILVRGVRVSTPYDGLAFIYQDGPDKYQPDYYVNWISSPAALLTGGLTKWLERVSPVPTVTTSASIHPATTLDTEVTRLLVDRTDPLRPRAIILIHFFLTRDANDGTTAILLNKSFGSEVTAASDTPAAYTVAWGEAYRQVLEQLTVALRSAVAGT